MFFLYKKVVKINIQFKKIENRYDKYYSYMKALSWDTGHTYSFDNESGIEWLMQKMIGAYNDNELVALGCIKINYDIEKNEKYSELSSIVDYRYRRKGIADKLLKEMLEYCKELNVQKVRVNILKSNMPSVSQIEKNEFDFVSFDDDIITFEKKLINN